MNTAAIAIERKHKSIFGLNSWFDVPHAIRESLFGSPWSDSSPEQVKRIQACIETRENPVAWSMYAVPSLHDYFRIWIQRPFPINLEEFLNWEEQYHVFSIGFREYLQQQSAYDKELAELTRIQRAEESRVGWFRKKTRLANIRQRFRGLFQKLVQPAPPSFHLQPPDPIFRHSDTKLLSFPEQKFIPEKVLIGQQGTELTCFRLPCYEAKRPGRFSFNLDSKIPDEERKEWTIRGSEIWDLVDVRRYASHFVFNKENEKEKFRWCYFWGGVPVVPHSTSSSHRLLIGGSGAGKTVLLNTLMRYLLPLPKHHEREDEWSLDSWTRQSTDKAIVYNAKSEQLPALRELGFTPSEDLIIFDPVEPEICWAWDVAADVEETYEITRFASLLISGSNPIPESKDAFWVDSSRQAVDAVVTCILNSALMAGKSKADWTLLDVIKAFRTPADFKKLVRDFHPDPEKIFAQVFDNPDVRTPGNVFQSLSTFLTKITPTAISWDEAAKAGRKISLKDFVRNGTGKVLVLPNTKENVPVYQPLNEVVLNHLSLFLQSRRLNPHTRKNPKTTQIFLDELQSAGRFEQLIDLAMEGRSFGVEMTFGFQSIEKLQDMYDEKLANTLLEQCFFRAYLKCQGETARWCEREVGKALVAVSKKSYTCGSTTQNTSGSTNTDTTSENTSGMPGSSKSSAYAYSSSNARGQSESTTDSTEEREQDVLMHNQLSGLPDIETTQTLGGYFTAPHLPVWQAELSLNELLTHGIEVDTNQLLIGEDEQKFKPHVVKWTDDDLKRLHLDKLKAGTKLKQPEAPWKTKKSND